LRVAVIGAGPSGLACALELERHGVCPDIFERNNIVGFAVPMTQVLLELFGRPQRDQLRYLSDNFNISVKPLVRLRKVTIRTPGRTARIGGNLGYILERGQGENSLEVQLSKKLTAKIKFDIQAEYKSLAGEYDYVVVADGTPAAAMDLKTWETSINAWVKGAIVLGRFNAESAAIYLNTVYARHGYGYLAPFSQERALLMLSVPDISRSETSDYWNTFLERENILPEIVETFEMNHVSGLSTRQRVDNILLVGNSGGFNDSFLGLGLVTGMVSGVLAGRAIARGLDYERLVRPIISRIRRLMTFREALNSMDNSSLDLLVGAITLPGVKQFIYNTKIDFVNLLYPWLKKR